MRESNQQPIKEAIENLLEEFHLQEKIREVKLVNSWEKIVGKTIFKYTRHISVKSKKLYLQIDSAPLKNDLLFMKQKLIDRVNEEIGDGYVDDIFIR